MGADLFVILHNNGTTGVYGAEANGTEVYVSNYSAYTEEGKKLGQMVLDNLAQLAVIRGNYGGEWYESSVTVWRRTSWDDH